MPLFGSVGSLQIMTFECLGAVTQAQFRFLDGRTVDGSVGLAPSAGDAFSGTHWEVTLIAPAVVVMRCLGTVEGPGHLRILDGRTLDGTVGLAPRATPPYSGTRWDLQESAAGVTLQCLGDAPGPRFLDGRTGAGTVGLAPSTDPPFSGTLWRPQVLGQIVTLECLGELPGPRFLDGHTGDGSVALSPTTATPFSGTLWLMHQDADVTLQCLGDTPGPRFLDGRTLDGTVGLTTSSDPPFSGTHWERVDHEPGVVSLRCLGTAEGAEHRRFLDGRTINGTVGLAPPADPPLSGTRWRIGMPSTVLGDTNVAPDDILAVHAALLPTGEILSFGGDEHDQTQHDTHATDHTRLFDCATGRVRNPGTPPVDLFCCGHAMLADGRVLVAGGTELFVHETTGAHHEHFPGLHEAWIFDGRAGQWISVGPLATGQLEAFRSKDGPPDPGGRWYPMLVTLGSGEILAVSGHPSSHDQRHNNHVAERFSPASKSWTLLWPPSPDFESIDAHVYPRLHVLPNRQVFCSTPLAATPRSQLIDPATGARSSAGDPPPDAINVGTEVTQDGTSVLLPLLPSDGYRPRVLLCGASQPVVMDLRPLIDNPAAQPQWVPTAPRQLAAVPPRFTGPNPQRFHLNAVLLPTGDVLVCGGCAVFRQDATAVLEPELYRPADGNQPDSWETLPATHVPRNYHSVALLMPDGRVWTAGSNLNGAQGRANLEPRTELINPPYMAAPARPIITSSAPTISYGASFHVQAAPAHSVSRVAILRAGSVTHAFNSDQRYVALNFSPGAGDQLDVQGPPGPNIAPPGSYLLFVVDNMGIPSAGSFVLVGP